MQRGRHRGRGEGGPGQLGRRPPGPRQPLAVGGEQPRSAAASAAASPGGTSTAAVAEHPALRRRVGGDQRAARGGALEDLVRHHPGRLRPVPKMPRQTSCPATSAGSWSGSTQSSQCTAAVAGGQRRVSSRSWPEPTMVTSTGSSASAARAAPITGAPCSGVKSPKNTTRSGAAGVTGSPGALPAYQDVGAPTGDHQARPRCAAGSASRCSSVSTTTRSALPSAAASSRRSSRCRQPAADPAVGRGVAGADQVVEHHGHVREQPPGQQHVEVPEVPDHDGVRPGCRPGETGGTGQPAGPAASSRQASRGSPHGLRSIPTRSAVESPSGALHSCTVAPCVPQPVAQDGNPGVRRSVVGAEEQEAHRRHTLVAAVAGDPTGRKPP